MSANLIGRYIWLIDTLKQRGRITRKGLNELWKQSPHSRNGESMCRRTLYNYKNAIAELFDIEIECDPATFEYYIVESDKRNSGFTDWLLNSSAVNEALSTSRDISDRIVLENVPSAREHLPLVLKTLKSNTCLRFDYHNYTRSRPTPGIVLEPYVARIFRQRWYVLGRNVKENKIKTYALDRMSKAVDTGIPFVQPEGFEPDAYFRYSFGIVVNESEPRDIVIRTNHHNAKYFAALPIHPSQQQTVHDHYCLFRYRMQITDDLVQELLSQGSRIVVEEPKELRMLIQEELRKTLEGYNNLTTYSTVVKNNRSLPVTDPEILGRPAAKERTDF